jgi:hypothetical protein
MELHAVSLHTSFARTGAHTHPAKVSQTLCNLVLSTYNCDFAAKLVLDLARLDRGWRILLDELVQVLDTHRAVLSRTVCLGLLVERLDFIEVK